MAERQNVRQYGNRETLSRQQRIRMRRRRERQRQKRLYLLLQFLIAAVIVLLLWNIRLQLARIRQTGAMADGAVISSFGTAKTNAGGSLLDDDYPAQFVGIEVDAPVKRSREEVLAKLESMAADNTVIREIWENRNAYPDNVLEALANNPEMADFVSGYLNADRQAQGVLSETEKAASHPLFLQWDPRWGYASYGDNSCIGIAGCGPTCLSMALYALTGNESLTPDKIAAYSMENGYYMSGTGTMWALMEDVPPNYGVSVEKPGISDSIMKSELSAGHVLICAMSPGDFTAAGHFIVIYGYDESGFLVNDPNCVARSQKSWPYENIKSQIKQMWSLGL